MSFLLYIVVRFLAKETLESVMSDVIKIWHPYKGGMREEVGKETTKKEMDLNVFLLDHI